ncbi:MAG: thymidine phosphorylase [Eubacteriales bacterium]|jgi:pyrimidine-nucleoside phosphorylase
MRIYDVLQKKRDGGELTTGEIQFFIQGVCDGSWADYQISAMLMALCIRGMTRRETVDLTLAMARSGEQYDLSSIPGVKVDKHSTGGVGDKVTLVAAPVCASLGVPIAKMSGRGLGFTGGTADKLEAIEGYQVDVPREKFFRLVRENGISLITQSAQLCPADRILYALRDVTGTVESLPLIVSSIMSKKLAAGADKIVLDVKVGSGAFMKTLESAEQLATAMISIGESCGRETVAVLSDMSTPLGRKIGNTLEVQEVLEVLSGGGPADLVEECVLISGMMLKLAGKGTLDQCKALAAAALRDGSAYEKFLTLVQAQGGKVENGQVCLRQEPVRSRLVTAGQAGYVSRLDALACGIASVELGAGRRQKGDPLCYNAGIELQKKPGDFVEKEEIIAVLYGPDEDCLDRAEAELRKGLALSEEAPAPVRHLLGILDRHSLPD